jgi:ferredoxin
MSSFSSSLPPRDAAQAAALALPVAEFSLIPLTSDGVVLVLGRDLSAIAAGERLADTLDVTVLLDGPVPTGLPLREFPVALGRIAAAKGHFGAYELAVDGFCAPRPDGGFAAPRNGAVSRCDLVVDLSGRPPLFPVHEARDGYLWADPEDGDAVERVLLAASDLVGEFDKRRYIQFREELCAHSRSQITGCTRCLEVCAMEAIDPAGDHVVIDPYVCAGCGNCAAVCPTGAASYALPPVDALLGRVRALLGAYREAGGRDAVVLFHDGYHGAPLVAELGEALPPNVLAFEVNEIKQLGLEAFSGALAYGASAVRVLSRRDPKNGIVALGGTIALANAFAGALGYGADACGLVPADTAEGLAIGLSLAPLGTPAPEPATFLPLGDKRGLLEVTLRTQHRVAPAPVDLVALPAGAPFGTLDVDVDGCTLCLSCVTACPTGALSAGEDRPSLRFAESACVQCGLCAATCPEDVITLKPQLDFAAWNAPRVIIKEEEPFPCIACGTPFGTRSTIERVVAKLSAGHWMFSGANARRLDAIKMCEPCRVTAALSEGFDPYAGNERPRPRTAEDALADVAGAGRMP